MNLKVKNIGFPIYIKNNHRYLKKKVDETIYPYKIKIEYNYAASSVIYPSELKKWVLQHKSTIGPVILSRESLFEYYLHFKTEEDLMIFKLSF
jgi:hypothetical protein